MAAIAISNYGLMSFDNQYTKAGVSDASTYVVSKLLALRSDQSNVRGNLNLIKSQIVDTLKELEISEKDSTEIDLKLSRVAAASLIKLANSLPAQVSSPEVAVEPTGSIGLEWITEHKRFLLVPNGDFLIYAGIFNKKVIHGKVDFKNELPEEITKVLSENFIE